jgi:hypothetical protein
VGCVLGIDCIRMEQVSLSFVRIAKERKVDVH